MNILCFLMSSLLILNSFNIYDFFGINSTKPFILDMDYSTDVDDILALRVANNLHKQGIIELKAIGLSTSDEEDLNIKAVDGLLDYDNIDNIPIGYSHQYIEDSSPYWDILSEYSDNEYLSLDSVTLYRYIISRSKQPVTICTTGYLNNIADLVQSGPDLISPFTGKQLLERNNTIIYITGGEPNGWSNNLSFYPESREATEYLIKNIDNLIFIQSDTGGAFSSGENLQLNYKEDPVSKSLWDFNGSPVGRWAWDPTAVWIAAYQDYEYCNVSIDRIDIVYDKETGYDMFVFDEDGRHSRICRSHDNIEFYKNIIDNLIIKE